MNPSDIGDTIVRDALEAAIRSTLPKSKNTCHFHNPGLGLDGYTGPLSPSMSEGFSDQVRYETVNVAGLRCIKPAHPGSEPNILTGGEKNKPNPWWDQ